MSVLDRDALAASPLADLHLIASELGIDSFRRLRKDDLIDAIVARQSGEEVDRADAVAEEEPAPARRRRSRRRRRDADEDAEPGVEAAEPEPEPAAEEEPRRERRGRRPEPEGEEEPRRERRGRRPEPEGEEEPRRERRGRRPEPEGEEEPRRARGGRRPEPEPEEEPVVEGVVELLPNGSGFVRLSPPEPSEDDVYVSAAQVRRCELVSGDRIGGPVRRPRRSERYPSLVRVDTINGEPAEEVAAGTPFDELPATFPTERLALGADDPTVKAIEWLTPFGRGSRVSIVGSPRSGKTEALRRLAAALSAVDGLDLQVVLAGARPEELAEWQDGPVAPLVAVSLAASADAQAGAIEHGVDHGRRVAARGGDAVVLIDTLAYVPPGAARKALAAARNIVDGGSLTVIATALEPVGGETTVIAFDHELTSTGRFPALDLLNSGSLRADLLVGEAGAKAIADARAEALA
jgi:transcription termination factor Rho